MTKIELLAPAGSIAAFKAAVDNGADAVYIGGKTFSARQFADNFSEEVIEELVAYAHVRGVKVYVACNTLIKESEWQRAIAYVRFLYEALVDGVIVQDLGLASYIHTNYPDFPLHASTQINVHNQMELEMAKKLGFSRVIIAREVNLATINDFSVPGIELEAFIHGALCYSYSGNCLMSYSIGGRSGNRGMCAQPCRKTYQLWCGKQKITDYEPLLSMKDLNTIQHLDQILTSNLTSLKIEGRMKTPEYVATVVKAYRMAIDHYYANHEVVVSSETTDNLARVFNRQFTKGYLLNSPMHAVVNRKSVNHQGLLIGEVTMVNNKKVLIKLTKPLNIGDGIRFCATNNQKNETGLVVNQMYVGGILTKHANSGDLVTIPVNFEVARGQQVVQTAIASDSLDSVKLPKISIGGHLVAHFGKPISLKVSDGVHEIEVLGPVLTELANKPLDLHRLTEQLKKTGNTVYAFSNITFDCDEQYYIAISTLNELRRKALEEFDEIRAKVATRLLNTVEYEKQKEQASATKLDIGYEYGDNLAGFAKQVPDFVTLWQNSHKFMPTTIHQLIASRYGGKITQNPVIVHNVFDLSSNSNAMCSMHCNITNHYAFRLAISLGAKAVYLSLELEHDEIMNLLQELTAAEKAYVALFVYGHYDLMYSKHCLISSNAGDGRLNCQKCHEQYYLVDEYRNKMAIMTDEFCHNRITSYQKINLLDQISDFQQMGINHFGAHFYEIATNDFLDVWELLKCEVLKNG